MDRERGADVVLALSILGHFDFSGWPLVFFARECCVSYLEDNSPEVRRVAAITCCNLVVRDATDSGVLGAIAPPPPAARRQRTGRSSVTRASLSNSSPATGSSARETLAMLLPGQSARNDASPAKQTGTGIVVGHDGIALRDMTDLVVSDIIEKLLTVAVADPDARIRETVLLAFSHPFDRHLSQPDNLQCLLLALNDEHFDNRQHALDIVGRLVRHNPAYIMPRIRKVLVHYLAELQFSEVNRVKDESSRLLICLIGNTQRYIQPYLHSIIHSLLPKLEDPDPIFSSRMLVAIAELAQVGGGDLAPYLSRLFRYAVDLLQNPNSSLAKRQSALRALGKLVANTGWVVEPYLQHRNLLGILVSFLLMGNQGGMSLGLNIAAYNESHVWSVKREASRVMGLLGALDPYRYKDAIALASKEATTEFESGYTAATSLGEEYYADAVITSFVKLLGDDSVAQYHRSVTAKMVGICKLLGDRCSPMLPKIMPCMIRLIGSCGEELKRDRSTSTVSLQHYVEHLIVVVAQVKRKILPYVTSIFDFVHDHWATDAMQLHILQLVEALVMSMGADIQAYLPRILSQLMLIFEKAEPDSACTSIVLKILDLTGHVLEEYLHLVVPALVRFYSAAEVPEMERSNALKVLARMAHKMNITDYASMVVHSLLRVVQQEPGLAQTALGTLCALVCQLGVEYATFITMVSKVLSAQRVTHTTYDMLVARLLKNDVLTPDMLVLPTLDIEDVLTSAEMLLNSHQISGSNITGENAGMKLPMNQPVLTKACDTTSRSTKEEWMEWMKRLSMEFLLQSPSPSIRAAAAIGTGYYPLARELLNVAFISCWVDLYDQYQDQILKSIESAITSPSLPVEILQTFLNLAEYMEHSDKALRLDGRMLAQYATKCHAYAKALHYEEMEFRKNPNAAAIENLISLNNQLQHADGAAGILKFAQVNHRLNLKESWYERLHQWEEALGLYRTRFPQEPHNFEITSGMVRCYHALGEWEQLSDLVLSEWDHIGAQDLKRSIAPLAADAAWSLKQYDHIDDYIAVMPRESNETYYLRTVLTIHRGRFPQAEKAIEKARENSIGQLVNLLGESYPRAYQYALLLSLR